MIALRGRGMGPAIRTAHDFLAVTVAEQLFGVPLAAVRDVFRPASVTPVPSASADVAGVLNLRGRIVTLIDMRARLGVACAAHQPARMAVGIEWDGESYGLMVDRVGDVLHLTPETFAPNPLNLDGRWAGVSAGLHRLEKGLMIVLDVERLLAINVHVDATAPMHVAAPREMQGSTMP